MTILALEFSSPQRSVAVARGEKVLAEAAESGGANAFGLIEKVLVEGGVEREAIEIIAVGRGPGSYTGVRAAIALAQGWQLARDVKLLGIGSADSVAAQAWAEKLFGRVNVVMDAQRNEIYLAGYEITAAGWRETAPLKITSPAAAQSAAGVDETFVGPEVTKWFPAGKILFPRAAVLAELALRRNDFACGETLQPIYLREPNFSKAPPAVWSARS